MCVIVHNFSYFLSCNSPTPAKVALFLMFLGHTHNDTPHLVELLCTRNSPIYLTTHNTHNRDIHAPSGTFCCILLYSVRRPYLCLCLDCPAFCLLSVLAPHNRQTSMSSAGLEPSIPQASGRRPTPQTARPAGSTFEPDALISDRPLGLAMFFK